MASPKSWSLGAGNTCCPRRGDMASVVVLQSFVIAFVVVVTSNARVEIWIRAPHIVSPWYLVGVVGVGGDCWRWCYAAVLSFSDEKARVEE